MNQLRLQGINEQGDARQYHAQNQAQLRTTTEREMNHIKNEDRVNMVQAEGRKQDMLTSGTRDRARIEGQKQRMMTQGEQQRGQVKDLLNQQQAMLGQQKAQIMDLKHLGY